MERPINIIAYLGPSGSKLYRAEQVFKYLNRTGGFQCVISPNFPNDQELLWADIIFLQHTVEPKAIAEAWAYKIERGKKIVTDRDDALETTVDNPFDKRNRESHAKSWTQELLKIADLVTVTTEEIYKESISFNKNVHVLPNYLDMELWDIGTTQNETGKIRIGWAGSMTHRTDLQLILPILKKILCDTDNVKFIYCGDATIAQELKEIPADKHEYIQAIGDVHQWGFYAQRVLQFDIALAPLVDNHFNRCKSYLKYLEYGMMRLAGIYSPVAYKGVVRHGVNGFLAKSATDWEEIMRELVKNEELRKQIGENAYKDVKNRYAIKEHINDWAALYKALLK